MSSTYQNPTVKHEPELQRSRFGHNGLTEWLNGAYGPLPWALLEPPIGIEPMTFSLRVTPASYATVHASASLQVRAFPVDARVQPRPSQSTGLAH